MKKFLEPIVVIAIVISVISLNFIPTINAFLKSPPDTVYAMVHNYVMDYYIYLSFITEGQNGFPLAYELHTGEPHQGSLSHILYLSAGWLTGPLKIPPYVVYQLLRLIGALSFAFAVYWFISLFASSRLDRLILFFLAYASGPIPQSLTTTFIAHLTQIDALRRSAFIPHFTVQNAMFLFALGFLIKNKIVFAGILIFVLNLFSPFHSGLLLLVYFSYLLLKIAHSLLLKKTKQIKSYLKNITILLAFFLPTFIYIQYAYSHGPLANIRLWESFQQEDIFAYIPNFLRHVGFTMILSILGIFIALKKGHAKNYFIILLTVLTYFFLFNLNVDRKIGISNFRFLNLPTYVFLGIFSFYVIKLFYRIKYLILIPIIFTSLLSYSIIFKQISAETLNSPYNVFIPDDLYDGIIFLKNNTNKYEDVVLSRYLTGNIIPGLSGNRVYLGHQVSTINFSQKSVLVEKFYNNQMNAEQAQKFLKDNGITLVFDGLEESPTFNPPAYPFLKEIYKNNSSAIYKL